MKRIYSFLLLFAMLLLIFWVVYIVAYPFISVKYDANAIWGRLGGGGCHPPLYDLTGRSHELRFLGTTNYIIPAPLFYVSDDQFLQDFDHVATMEDCSYPDYIDPSYLKESAQTYYPFYVSTEIPEKWIRSGESIDFKAKLEVKRYFSKDSSWGPWTENKQGEVIFSLNAPNFEFQPDNGVAAPKKITIYTPAENNWVIAPKERTLGSQTMLVEVYLEEDDSLPMAARINFSVKPLIGINATTIAVVSTISGAISWILLSLKTAKDIVNKNNNKQK